MFRYTCGECDRGFEIYSTYYSHKKRHGQPTKACLYCDRRFYTNADLYKHMWKCKDSAEHAAGNQPTQTQPKTQQTNSLVPAMFRH
jgi:hypothetical protein